MQTHGSLASQRYAPMLYLLCLEVDTHTHTQRWTVDTHTHRVAAWEQPGATCTWTPELPSPGFTPHVQLTDTHTYTCTHTHTDTHTHIQLSDTHTE